MYLWLQSTDMSCLKRIGVLKSGCGAEKHVGVHSGQVSGTGDTCLKYLDLDLSRLLIAAVRQFLNIYLVHLDRMRSIQLAAQIYIRHIEQPHRTQCIVAFNDCINQGGAGYKGQYNGAAFVY